MNELLVIGIGNPDRGDDAIGLIIARRLAPLLSQVARVIERTGDALGLLEDWSDAGVVILIDAAARATRPGVIHRVDLVRDPLPVDLAPASTHAFGLTDAIALARSLRLLPREAILYAIEGNCFDLAAPVTPAVLEAVDEVVACVRRDLQGRPRDSIVPPRPGTRLCGK